MIDIAPFDRLPPSATNAQSLKKGERLFLQGDRTRFMAYVESGGLKLVRHLAVGTEIVVHNANTGQTVAEAAIFSTHYHCDCLATEDTDLILISLDAIKNALNSDQVFSNLLLARLARQVVSLRARLELVAIPSAKARVLLAVSEGLHTGTIRTLAAQIQLSPEATNRALSQLVREGILQKAGRGRYRLAYGRAETDPPGRI